MSPKPPILAFDAHLSLPRRCGAGAGRVGGFVAVLTKTHSFHRKHIHYKRIENFPTGMVILTPLMTSE